MNSSAGNESPSPSAADRSLRLATSEEVGARIELKRIGGRLVHLLQERILENGFAVELLVEGDLWVPGTYEWSGLAARWPGLRVTLGRLSCATEAAGGERIPKAVMALHPDAVVRWSRR